MRKQFMTVTPLSKIIALALVIALPFIGFYLGMKYQASLGTPLPIMITKAISK